MKTINITFENKEFDKLEKAKMRSGQNWERFFLLILKKYEELKV